jgi:hypothetical protein
MWTATVRALCHASFVFSAVFSYSCLARVSLPVRLGTTVEMDISLPEFATLPRVIKANHFFTISSHLHTEHVHVMRTNEGKRRQLILSTSSAEKQRTTPKIGLPNFNDADFLTTSRALLPNKKTDRRTQVQSSRNRVKYQSVTLSATPLPTLKGCSFFSLSGELRDEIHHYDCERLTISYMESEFFRTKLRTL